MPARNSRISGRLVADKRKGDAKLCGTMRLAPLLFADHGSLQYVRRYAFMYVRHTLVVFQYLLKLDYELVSNLGRRHHD